MFTDNNLGSHLQSARLGAVKQWWVAQLALSDFEIKNRAGRENIIVDSPHPDSHLNIWCLACFHSNKSQSFETALMKQLCPLHSISNTGARPWHPTPTASRLNHSLCTLCTPEMKKHHRWLEHLPKQSYNKLHASWDYLPETMLGQRKQANRFYTPLKETAVA